MSTVSATSFTNTLDNPAIGTIVHVAVKPHDGRLLASDHRVANAYRALRCKIGFGVNLSFVGLTYGYGIEEASPLWAVAAHELEAIEARPSVLVGRLNDRRDLGGFNWLGTTLGLDPDYCRGFSDGFFGVQPLRDEMISRQGWRDGAACYRDLAGFQDSVI